MQRLFLFFSSHSENFGVVVAEPLSCKKSVLITVKVNIWQEIDEHHAGLIESDTLDGTLKSIKRWLSFSENQKEQMRENAIKYFSNNFDIKKTAIGTIWQMPVETIDNLHKKPFASYQL